MTESTAPGRRHPVPAILETLYRRLLGEQRRESSPPKRAMSSTKGGKSREEKAAERKARVEAIEVDLGHIAHVIRLYEPFWTPDSLQPIRPMAQRRSKPRGGWGLVALGILREIEEPVSIQDLTAAIADRWDIDISSPSERQRCRNSVSKALNTTYRNSVMIVEGDPPLYGIRPLNHRGSA
jgi:hypothetical protein